MWIHNYSLQKKKKEKEESKQGIDFCIDIAIGADTGICIGTGFGRGITVSALLESP